MARRLDKILVVDIEATCSNDGTVDAKTGEIIEIGVCPLVAGFRGCWRRRRSSSAHCASTRDR